MSEKIEQVVVSQYSKIFRQQDWKLFKDTADYYFKYAACLMTTDLQPSRVPSLLIRNIQKRLFLGIAGELIVKSIFLRNGYYINLPKDSNAHPGMLLRFDAITDNAFQEAKTFTFINLSENLQKVVLFQEKAAVKGALTVLRLFRNKEGHIVTARHAYDPDTFRTIETGIRALYSEAFLERLNFRIGMAENEKGMFAVRK